MTYYKGIDPPDHEPRRNTYSSKKSKFTEEVAAQVTDGDLYLSLRASAGYRYWVQVNPGEHGLGEEGDGGLICVTHVFRKHSWEDDPKKGKWEPYDGEGNLVIRVDSSSESGSKAYAARRAIESALYHTPLGRAVGSEALRKMTDELAEQFGLAPYARGDEQPTFTVNKDQELRVKKAVRDLLKWAPDTGYDDRIGDMGAEYDGFGFAQDAKEYDNLINGVTNGFGKSVPKERRGRALPLMSQPVYYAIAGSKDEGRGFAARIRELEEAAGVQEEEEV